MPLGVEVDVAIPAGSRDAIRVDWARIGCRAVLREEWEEWNALGVFLLVPTWEGMESVVVPWSAHDTT